MEKIEDRISKLEDRVDKLNKRLDRFIDVYNERSASCHTVAQILAALAGSVTKEATTIWEKLDPTFAAAFPKHAQYLVEIDRALSRAGKRAP